MRHTVNLRFRTVSAAGGAHRSISSFYGFFDSQFSVIHPFGILIDRGLTVVLVANVLLHPALGVDKLLEHGEILVVSFHEQLRSDPG